MRFVTTQNYSYKKIQLFAVPHGHFHNHMTSYLRQKTYWKCLKAGIKFDQIQSNRTMSISSCNQTAQIACIQIIPFWCKNIPCLVFITSYCQWLSNSSRDHERCCKTLIGDELQSNENQALLQKLFLLLWKLYQCTVNLDLICLLPSLCETHILFLYWSNWPTI